MVDAYTMYRVQSLSGTLFIAMMNIYQGPHSILPLCQLVFFKLPARNYRRMILRLNLSHKVLCSLLEVIELYKIIVSNSHALLTSRMIKIKIHMDMLTVTNQLGFTWPK